MKPRHISSIVSSVLPLFMLAACGSDAPGPTNRDLAAVTTTTGALKKDINVAGELTTNVHDAQAGHTIPVGGPCECTKTYKDGSVRIGSSCDPSGCADLEHMQECEAGTRTDCNFLRSCSCYCTDDPVEQFEHDASDGVFVTGVPELWQFNYGCSVGGTNAVGCGPVALASMFYWWAQRGYPNLVEDHLTSGGLQDWKSLVRELRDDYADGGLCIPRDPTVAGSSGQYAVFQDKLEDALKEYVDDHGYFAYVSQYRACDGCNLNDTNDRSKSGGLDVIKDQLEDGKPLILGYNAGRAEQSSVSVDGEVVFTGDLSNGLGWIDHYAVITGYRRTSDGRDVIYVNKGWQSREPGVVMEWKPGGKWTHLFTLSISTDANSSAEFCSLDQQLSSTFSETTDVEVSHGDRTNSSDTRQLTVMAGNYCGISREGHYEMYTPAWRTTDYCPTLAHYNNVGDTVLDGPLGNGNEPLDQLGPR